MKQFKSETRAIRRGNLKHKLTQVPSYRTGGVLQEGLYDVELQRRTSRGRWVFYKSKGQIFNPHNKGENDKAKD